MVEFPGFWRFGVQPGSRFYYVANEGDHVNYSIILDALMNDVTGVGFQLKSMYDRCDFTDFCAVIECQDHMGTRVPIDSDITGVVPGGQQIAITLTGRPQERPAVGSGRSSFLGLLPVSTWTPEERANAGIAEPLAEDDVSFHDRDNLYTDIASPTAITFQDP